MNAFDKEGPCKCAYCQSSFATQQGLNMHKGHKHKDLLEEKSDPPTKMGTIMLSWDQVELLVDYALREIMKRT